MKEKMSPGKPFNESDIRRYIYSSALKREELDTITDILDLDKAPPVSTEYGNPKDRILENVMVRLKESFFLEAPYFLAPFYKKEAKKLIFQDRMEDAFHVFHEMLSLIPNDRTVDDYLARKGNGSQSVHRRLASLRDKYRFDYDGFFGEGVLTWPLCMVVNQDNHTLYVSDRKENQVFRFSFDGRYRGALPIKFNAPLGLFNDENGGIWICDSLNCRILSIDQNERITRIIDCDRIEGYPDGSLHPAFGCMNHKRIYLVLKNQNGRCRILSCLDLNPSTGVPYMEPIESIRAPDGIHSSGRRLYVTDMTRGDLYSYHVLKKRWARIMRRGPHPYSPRRCINVGAFLFVSTGKKVLKCDAAGKDIYVVDMTDTVGKKNVRPLDFATIHRGNRQILWISDLGAPACIHRIRV